MTLSQFVSIIYTNMTPSQFVSIIWELKVYQAGLKFKVDFVVTL